jgi:hypothetical protein
VALAVCAPPASAAQLPTPAQAKALRSAFERTHQGDLIRVIKVSTKDGTWAEIESLRKVGGGGKAREAKVKIINVAPVDYHVSHGKAKQVPVKQVPKPAAKDLARHFVLDITIKGSGSESGTEMGLESDGCTMANATLTSTLNFTVRLRYDFDDQPFAHEFAQIESANSSILTYTFGSPTDGTLIDVYKLTETPGSGAGCTPGPALVTTCNGNWTVGSPVHGPAAEDNTEFSDSGAYLNVPNYPAQLENCSNQNSPSIASNDLYTARWPQSMMFWVPIHLIPGFGKQPIPDHWNVSWPADGFPRGQQETVTDPSKCQLGPLQTGCSDKLQWHGTVDLSDEL